MTLEADRALAISRNRALLADLNILRPTTSPSLTNRPSTSSKPRLPPSKKRKLSPIAPSRTSARIANIKPTYQELPDDYDDPKPRRTTIPPKSKSRAARSVPQPKSIPSHIPRPTHPDISSLRSGWTSWSPTAPPPTRSPQTSQFHFPTHPLFTPNKSPSEMLHEGVFGGSYFRPLYSRHLDATISEDWKELPPEWTSDLNPTKFLTNEQYDPEINKYGVKCGQSIEEWELAGWINHAHDIRGWFQWYCRFFMGRRCEDDDRQVSRWAKCVGPKGRWRSLLLKKYLQMGVREVWDDGEEVDEDGRGKEVSPVMHQTCFQWGWEVRQEELDELWRGR